MKAFAHKQGSRLQSWKDLCSNSYSNCCFCLLLVVRLFSFAEPRNNKIPKMKKPLDPAEKTALLMEQAIAHFMDVKRGLDVSKSCTSTSSFERSTSYAHFPCCFAYYITTTHFFSYFLQWDGSYPLILSNWLPICWVLLKP